MVGELDALLRTRAALPFWARYSRPLRVTFSAPNTRRDVVHDLGTTPDGMFVVWGDATITAYPGVAWTDTVASLQAASGNAHAVLVFYTLREEPAQGSTTGIDVYTPPAPPSLMTVQTWVPELIGLTTGGSQTYNDRSAVYMRFEKVVLFSMRIYLAIKSGASGFTGISGLPLVSSNNVLLHGVNVSYFANITLPAGITVLTGLITQGQNVIQVMACGSGGVSSNLDIANVNNNSVLVLNGFYNIP